MDYLKDKTPEEKEIFEFVKAQIKKEMPEWPEESVNETTAVKLQWI
jgi:hypothetical protein